MQFVKTPLIIIDGMDRSGKTSLIDYINKRINYQRLLIERGPITSKAYCEIFNRNDPSVFDELENFIINIPHICCVLTAPIHVIEQRFKNTNEHSLPNNTTILQNMNAILKYAKLSKLNCIFLNTFYLTFEEMYVKIVNNFNNIYKEL